MYYPASEHEINLRHSFTPLNKDIIDEIKFIIINELRYQTTIPDKTTYHNYR